MKKTILFLVSILTVSLSSTLTFAETVGEFSKVEGRVDILKAGATAAAPVKTGDDVAMGDIVRTKSDGRAEITFKDETTIRLAPDTRMKIDEYIFNPDNTRSKGVLGLFRGKVRAVVSKAKSGIIPAGFGGSTFNINTPTAIAGVRGTDFFVFFDKGITGVIFKEGQGFVVNPNVPERIVNVSAGQVAFVVQPDAPPLAPRLATGIELAVHTKDTTPAEEKRGDETYIKDFRGGIKKEAKAEELGNYQGDEPATLTYSPLSEGSPRDKASAVQGDMYSSGFTTDIGVIPDTIATTITIPPTSLIPVTETQPSLLTDVKVNLIFR